MDGIVLRYWPKGLGCALALSLLLSLLSFHLQDPTLANLRLPSEGVANWLGLPGALLGGSLLELLGSSALAVPLLCLNWVFSLRARPPFHRYALWSVCLLLAASGLHALVQPPDMPGLLDAGLAGWTLRRWAELTTGPWIAGALLAFVAAEAVVRVVYAPIVRTGLRDARLFARWLVRESGHGWRSGTLAVRQRASRMQRVAGATALGLGGRAGLGLAGLFGLLLFPVVWLRDALRELRSPSLARIKTRAAAAGAAGDAELASPTLFEDEAERFARWFEPALDDALAAPTLPVAPGDTDPLPPSPVSPPLPIARHPAPQEPDERASPVAASSAAPKVVPPRADDDEDEHSAATAYTFEHPEAEAAWRERFQRYARNLDLDWEEQLWRRQEEEPADDREDTADPEP